MLYSVILVVHILVGLGVIGLVLMQHGKGADMGAAFGSGASGSLFGATGSANFLSRATAVLAAVFFATSLTLAYLARKPAVAPSGSVVDTVKAPPEAAVPPVAPTIPAADAKSKEVPK